MLPLLKIAGANCAFRPQCCSLAIVCLFVFQEAGSSSFLRVLHADNIVQVLHEVHAEELKHSGYKKVLEYAQRHYQGPTRNYVQKFYSMCPTCQLSAPQLSRPPLQPLIQKDFLERVQIDLIDMRHCPDREFHYIAHFMDHFSKFHVLFPLKTKSLKSAKEVAQALEERVLAYFGPPKIFHSDNGREFVNNLVKSLFQTWGGQVTFVTGRPHIRSHKASLKEEIALLNKKSPR